MRFARVADETHAPRLEIGEAADVIVDRAVAGSGQRIDGEIAPLGVSLPVATEGNLGVAAIGLHVLAQRGHLERMFVDDHGDGAVLNSRGHRLEACRAHALDHFVRHGCRGDVDFLDQQSDQRVTHRAADRARLLAVAVEHGQQARQRAALKPGGIGKRARGRTARHLTRPGTNFPFSICAGT